VHCVGALAPLFAVPLQKRAVPRLEPFNKRVRRTLLCIVYCLLNVR
jgi:hypothetical protein